MLQRCYSPKNHAKNPTYIGCYVAKEWLTFSNFKAWMGSQQWQGMELDKGVISPYMLTDKERKEAVLDDCYILMYDKRIGSMKDLVTILETVA